MNNSFKWENNWIHYELHNKFYKYQIGEFSNYPKTLYKYYPLNTYSLNAIKNGYFYVSSPEEFNDLFEFNFKRIGFSNISKIEIIRQFQILLEDKHEGLSREELIDLLQYNLVAVYLPMFGILSLSQNDLNDLLWAYYTNNEGFQLEINVDQLNNSFYGPYKVEYPPILKKLEINSIPPPVLLYLLISEKKYIWRHEEEYRFLVTPPPKEKFHSNGRFSFQKEHNLTSINREAKYSKETIESITLGYNFFLGINTKKENNEWIRVSFSDTDSFPNEKLQLKLDLLNHIVKNSIKLKIINQEVSKFQLEKEKLSINKINDFEFLISNIQVQ